jgi:preprotein translocase subunit SecG
MVQNPKGGGLSSSFGGGDSQQLGGVKQTGDFLDKSTWFLAGILLVLILVTNSLINFPDAINESSLLDNNIINEEITESFIDEVPENQENVNN